MWTSFPQFESFSFHLSFTQFMKQKLNQKGFLWDSLFLTLYLTTYTAHSNKNQLKFLFQQGTKDSHWIRFYYPLGGIPHLENERLKQYIRHVPAAFTSVWNHNLPGIILRIVIIPDYYKTSMLWKEEKCSLNWRTMWDVLHLNMYETSSSQENVSNERKKAQQYSVCKPWFISSNTTTIKYNFIHLFGTLSISSFHMYYCLVG